MALKVGLHSTLDRHENDSFFQHQKSLYCFVVFLQKSAIAAIHSVCVKKYRIDKKV